MGRKFPKLDRSTHRDQRVGQKFCRQLGVQLTLDKRESLHARRPSGYSSGLEMNWIRRRAHRSRGVAEQAQPLSVEQAQPLSVEQAQPLSVEQAQPLSRRVSSGCRGLLSWLWLSHPRLHRHWNRGGTGKRATRTTGSWRQRRAWRPGRCWNPVERAVGAASWDRQEGGAESFRRPYRCSELIISPPVGHLFGNKRGSAQQGRRAIVEASEEIVPDAVLQFADSADRNGSASVCGCLGRDRRTMTTRPWRVCSCTRAVLLATPIL